MSRHDETTHALPPDGGSGLTPCCGMTPFELPHTDRMTATPALVTCRSEPAESVDRYVPTTDDVREDFAYPWEGFTQHKPARLAAFDRWLEALKRTERAAAVGSFAVDEAGNTFRANETLDTMRATRDRTIAAAGDKRIKATLRNLGWIAPEAVPDHDAEVAARVMEGVDPLLRVLWIVANRLPEGIYISAAELASIPDSVGFNSTEDLSTRGTRICTINPATAAPTQGGEA